MIPGVAIGPEVLLSSDIESFAALLLALGEVLSGFEHAGHGELLRRPLAFSKSVLHAGGVEASDELLLLLEVAIDCRLIGRRIGVGSAGFGKLGLCLDRNRAVESFELLFLLNNPGQNAIGIGQVVSEKVGASIESGVFLTSDCACPCERSDVGGEDLLELLYRCIDTSESLVVDRIHRHRVLNAHTSLVDDNFEMVEASVNFKKCSTVFELVQ